MKSNLPHAIANAIKTLRQEKSLSQESLAETAGLDRTYISGIEREVRNPTIKSIQKIIEALKIKDEDFLDAIKTALNED